ncbi:hypothetical protein M407DRAFT_244063 [Tulasnella calospora MUT 4182]|uniref:Uncharacterized protein n=1 Tax=Tulasnella calospora MUT 4182 TaxID=1051891 RepID=A0A0C3QGJ2_9AGAM|nr:hypothetical protein M407DRAFT_244063 [Tulasnella calospora MUT 4182]
MFTRPRQQIARRNSDGGVKRGKTPVRPPARVSFTRPRQQTASTRGLCKAYNARVMAE